MHSELIRVAYDLEKVAQAVEASPLHNEYADMLRKAYQWRRAVAGCTCRWQHRF